MNNFIKSLFIIGIIFLCPNFAHSLPVTKAFGTQTGLPVPLVRQTGGIIVSGIYNDKDSNRTDVWYFKDVAEVNTQYTYYKNHLLKTTTYPGFNGNNVTTNYYDGNGNLTSRNDGKSQTIGYTYDKEGNRVKP